MNKPDDIPQDIWLSAIKCAETALRNLDGDYGDMTIEITAIARAIMAERSRCAEIARDAEDMIGEVIADRIEGKK